MSYRFPDIDEYCKYCDKYGCSGARGWCLKAPKTDYPLPCSNKPCKEVCPEGKIFCSKECEKLMPYHPVDQHGAGARDKRFN